jgi:NTE family protein
VGALVGAAYCSAQLNALEEWARGLGPVDVVRLLDATLERGGMMRGDRLMRRIREVLEDRDIEELDVPFAAVATRLETGHEIWLRSGSMLHAVRASSGLPGLFTPVHSDGHWLIDGGVVNSVPVSVCRAMGAEFVIAVNLNRHLKSYPRTPRAAAAQPDPQPSRSSWSLADLMPSLGTRPSSEPGVFEVIGATISIMQDRIMRSRMVGDPPDVVIDPEVGDLDIWDFHRAEEAMAAGKAACEAVAERLKGLR